MMLWLRLGALPVGVASRLGLMNLLSSPMRLLRTLPPLEALPVIGIAVTLVRDLPPELYDELVRHPYEINDY